MKTIQDKFTKLKVSRQRMWQLRNRKHGLCVICGLRAVTAEHCLKHAVYKREWAHKKYGCRSENDCQSRRLERGEA